LITWEGVLRFVSHGRHSLGRAVNAGWRAGARYTNLRDVRGLPFEGKGFLDIDWKNYDFGRHLAAVQSTRPLITVARDVIRLRDLDSILDQADQLASFASFVVIVPKARGFAGRISELIPSKFLLGYSVPTRYGETRLSPLEFRRPVHLLGGRPDVQRKLADLMPVVSLDCNRFTLDAAFGDYFNGQAFRPHPLGGYNRCLEDSLHNISRLWKGYRPRLRRPARGTNRGKIALACRLISGGSIDDRKSKK
jgi:uncharacterized protein DUF6610